MSDTPTPDIAAEIKSERRLEERHLVHWTMLLNWTTPAGPATVRGETIDLSLGGARVAVEHNFALGEKVACRLSVHPWHGNAAMFEIDMSAKVVHCAYSRQKKGFDVGLQFESFSGDGKQRFVKVVQAIESGVSVAGAKIIHSAR